MPDEGDVGGRGETGSGLGRANTRSGLGREETGRGAGTRAHASDEPGPDRNLAAAAFLLLVTSLWLPWWVVTYRDDAGRSYDAIKVHLFEDAAPAVFPVATIVTGVVVAATVVLLFVRLAARSWYHEPKSWRRDLLVSAWLTAAALASGLFWPDQVPHFWGGRTFQLADAPGSFTETALPGLGWWCGLVALLALVAARVIAVRRALARAHEDPA